MTRVEIVDTDNRDIFTTDLILDNDTVVEVDVVEIFENMLENIDESGELLDMFKELMFKLESL